MSTGCFNNWDTDSVTIFTHCTFDRLHENFKVDNETGILLIGIISHYPFNIGQCHQVYKDPDLAFDHLDL